MADMRIYDTVKKSLEYLEGTGGAAKVIMSGVDINMTAPSPYTVTNTPVTGAKTVTAVAAAIFAGASVLANRKQLSIRNDDPAIRIRVGPSGVTQQSGFPVEPGACTEFVFDAAAAKAIYAISEGAAVQVEVWEA